MNLFKLLSIKLCCLCLLVSLPNANAETLVLEKSLVEIRDEVQIPAPEAGVLMELPVREGSKISKDDILAVIDDREAQAQLKIAQYGLEAATKRATDKVEEKYARKAAEVSLKDWEIALDANERQKDAISQIEVMQKKLSYERALLQIEKAQKDRELAKLDARTKYAEREAAQLMVDWRTIKAPFGGRVVKSVRHEKEWVNPGDPILLLSRFDKLYVESSFDQTAHNREDLLGRDVTVRVKRAHGKEVTVTGKVVYIEPRVRYGDSVRLRAEIDNQQVNGHWLVHPGMEGTMEIHLDESVAKSDVHSSN